MDTPKRTILLRVYSFFNTYRFVLFLLLSCFMASQFLATSFQNQFLWKLFPIYWKWRRDEGTGESFSPPPTENFVIEIWCYLSEVYTFEAEAEIIAKFRENLWKKSISIEILIKKSQSFLKFFRTSIFSGPNAQGFACRFLSFPLWLELFIKCWLFCIYHQKPVSFLQKFQEFSPLYQYSFSI